MRDDARAIDDARVLTYVNPFLMRSRGNKGALYREAKAKGYMVTRQKSGKVYLLGTEPGVGYGLLDLTNPAAAAWFASTSSTTPIASSRATSRTTAVAG